VVLTLLALAPPVLAEGRVGGIITTPEGDPLPGIQLVLNEVGGGQARLSQTTRKNGQFLFGIVPEGEYTLTTAGTELAPHLIKVSVFDTQSRTSLLDYEGPPPSSPPVVRVGSLLKVTYDLVLGDPGTSPAALSARRQRAQTAARVVPALFEAGDYAGALQRLDMSLEAMPDDAGLHYMRGYALFRQGQNEAARSAIERALVLDSSQRGAHYVLGGILAAEGRKREAISEFKKELEGEADRASRINSYINIGLLNQELGNIEEAIGAFEKVIELDPTQAEAYAHLAQLYLTSGKPEMAAEIEARGESAGGSDAGTRRITRRPSSTSGRPSRSIPGWPRAGNAWATRSSTSDTPRRRSGRWGSTSSCLRRRLTLARSKR
jgi:Tfp pilus assembly protein PilF